MDKVLFSLLVVLVLAGCTSESSSDSYEVVTSSERIFAFEDLKAIGFKKNKVYDVTELTGATGAWYGFWRHEDTSKDFEVRFYTSHADAVSLGEELAKEVTGNNAVISKDDTTWKEGSKDRRQVGGGVDKGSLGLQATGIFPKYGNYAIYGNMVLLCEGQEEISLETCWKLISALVE